MVAPKQLGAESFISGTASCRIRVDDASALYTELKRHGIVHRNGELADQWWGDRDFSVLDPDGNLVTFFQRDAVQRRAPQ